MKKLKQLKSKFIDWLKNLFISNLSHKLKNDIYREILAEYTASDVKAYAKDNELCVSDDDADYLGKLWAYGGEYDCNFSYWDNIQNLIDNWL